jgi:HSP20 family protein
MASMVDPLAAWRAWRRAGETGPPVDLYETAEAVIVRLGVPGAEGASLALTIEEDNLVVRGETAPPGARWGERTVVHWQEIPYGRFERRVPLPAPVNKDGAKADFKNGVLEVTLPKKSPPKSRTIQIQIG